MFSPPEVADSPSHLQFEDGLPPRNKSQAATFLRGFSEMNVPADIQEVFKSALDDRPYRVWKGTLTIPLLALAIYASAHPASQMIRKQFCQPLALCSRLDMKRPTIPTSLGSVRLDPAGKCFPDYTDWVCTSA